MIVDCSTRVFNSPEQLGRETAEALRRFTALRGTRLESTAAALERAIEPVTRCRARSAPEIAVHCRAGTDGARAAARAPGWTSAPCQLVWGTTHTTALACPPRGAGARPAKTGPDRRCLRSARRRTRSAAAAARSGGRKKSGSSSAGQGSHVTPTPSVCSLARAPNCSTI